jgi:hypothetical protein
MSVRDLVSVTLTFSLSLGKTLAKFTYYNSTLIPAQNGRNYFPTEESRRLFW